MANGGCPFCTSPRCPLPTATQTSPFFQAGRRTTREGLWERRTQRPEVIECSGSVQKGCMVHGACPSRAHDVLGQQQCKLLWNALLHQADRHGF
eukprot:2223715-Rhodomonas_salina.1